MQQRLLYCRGFIMIEVLVALLVLGIGALATVMLMLHGMRSGRDSALHTRAMQMAGELAALRALHRQATPSNDAPYLFDVSPPSSPPGAATPPSPCSTSPCQPQDFVATEIAAWQQQLGKALPGARAVLCRDSQASSVAWPCDGNALSPLVLKLRWRQTASTTSTDNTAPPLMAVLVGR